jgi:hypothetical protein
MERALYFYNFLHSNPEVPDEYRVEERFKNAVKLLTASDPRLAADKP